MSKKENGDFMIHIGIVGAGAIGMRHIESLADIPDAKITAVCDAVPANAIKAARATGAIPFYDYREMADAIPLDVVIISLPHSLHAPCAIYFAERKVSVFLEKPMDISSEACKQMIRVCRDQHVLLMLGHVQRYFPENRAAKALIDSEKYGKLIGFSETRNTFYFSENRPGWFLRKELSGGGIMMNLGAHSLDKIKYFTDSDICTATGKIHIPSGSSVEDSVQAFITTESGVSATINLIGCTHAAVYETVLYLTGGVIRIHQGSDLSVASLDGKFHEVSYRQDENPFKLQMEELIATLRERSAPVVSGQYGLNIISAIESIYA